MGSTSKQLMEAYLGSHSPHVYGVNLVQPMSPFSPRVWVQHQHIGNHWVSLHYMWYKSLSPYFGTPKLRVISQFNERLTTYSPRAFFRVMDKWMPSTCYI